jgi:quercetin dioxygenase-like cupin family protein
VSFDVFLRSWLRIAAVQSWDLTKIEAPEGTRSPAVLETVDGARAIVIRLSPGQELGDHQVRERAWLTVIEGKVRIEAGGELVEAGPGTLLTFEPGEQHSVRSEHGAQIILILSPWPGEGHYPESQKASSK